ncbi:MAG TPA: RNA polymerase sigma factor [Candidatus Paceibacterota bacterium]|nr:RNA polymerase sigma factor [Candidatus Paceibacterota bacterium]
MKERNRAFEDAFGAYADELFRHAFFHVSDRERAVDLVQDTYLRAYEYAKGADIANMRAFLYRTLRHLIIDEYRKKKSVSLDAMLEKDEHAADVRVPAEEHDALEAAMDRLDAAQAAARLRELPGQYAEVLALRYLDGLTIAEIADRLDVTQNLVSVRIHRALKSLKDLLETP